MIVCWGFAKNTWSDPKNRFHAGMLFPNNGGGRKPDYVTVYDGCIVQWCVGLVDDGLAERVTVGFWEWGICRRFLDDDKSSESVSPKKLLRYPRPLQAQISIFNSFEDGDLECKCLSRRS